MIYQRNTTIYTNEAPKVLNMVILRNEAKRLHFVKGADMHDLTNSQKKPCLFKSWRGLHQDEEQKFYLV